jgi:hypothetical protein
MLRGDFVHLFLLFFHVSQCPSERRLRLVQGRCSFFSSWGARPIVVAGSCCRGTHYQAPGNREVRRNNDKAANAYHQVCLLCLFFLSVLCCGVDAPFLRWPDAAISAATRLPALAAASCK